MKAGPPDRGNATGFVVVQQPANAVARRKSRTPRYDRAEGHDAANFVCGLNEPDDVFGIYHRLEPLEFAWEPIATDGQKIGGMTACGWSRRLRQNIGFALISRDNGVGQTVKIIRPSGPTRAEVVDLPG